MITVKLYITVITKACQWSASPVTGLRVSVALLNLGRKTGRRPVFFWRNMSSDLLNVSPDVTSGLKLSWIFNPRKALIDYQTWAHLR